MTDAIAAYLHYVAIFTTVILLGSEVAIYRREVPAAFVRLLPRIDAGFGIAAMLLIATGIFRIFASGKGWHFYAGNPIFWTKMALFATLGILSIWPTMHFLSWRKSARPDGSVSVESSQFARIRTFLVAELAVLFAIPLFAALMSRGIGLPGISP